MKEFGRRDILRIFGAGATVIPIIGGALEPAATARIVEPPKVELVGAPLNGLPLNMIDVQSFSVTLSMRDGSRRTIQSGYIYGNWGLHASGAVDQVKISLNESVFASPQSSLPMAEIYGEGVIL
jgi:hypothetical protein